MAILEITQKYVTKRNETGTKLAWEFMFISCSCLEFLTWCRVRVQILIHNFYVLVIVSSRCNCIFFVSKWDKNISFQLVLYVFIMMENCNHVVLAQNNTISCCSCSRFSCHVRQKHNKKNTNYHPYLCVGLDSCQNTCII